MQAVVIEDGQLSFQERPDPPVGDTELLVEVRAAGINRGDVMQRDGFYPAPPGFPADIPGMEVAGQVVAVGRSVTRFQPGEAVMAVVGGGGHATRCALDETHALSVPQGTAWDEAGGFPEVFSTAYDALCTQCALAPGDRVLVTGAAGGVGTAGIQLAASAGAHVVAAARHVGHFEALESLGASEVIEPDAVGEHGPYDIVLELIGAASLPSAIAALASGGRVAVIGVGGGSRIELDLLALMGRRARISGSTLRPRARDEKAAVARAVQAHVVPLLSSGRIRVPIAQRFEMADAAAAYQQFEAGGKFGKLVLLSP